MTEEIKVTDFRDFFVLFLAAIVAAILLTLLDFVATPLEGAIFSSGSGVGAGGIG